MFLDIAFATRLIPYLLCLWLAWLKGYNRLAISTLALVAITVFNFTAEPSPEVRAILGAVFSFLFFLHVQELTPKGRK